MHRLTSAPKIYCLHALPFLFTKQREEELRVCCNQSALDRLVSNTAQVGRPIIGNNEVSNQLVGLVRNRREADEVVHLTCTVLTQPN